MKFLVLVILIFFSCEKSNDLTIVDYINTLESVKIIKTDTVTLSRKDTVNKKTEIRYTLAVTQLLDHKNNSSKTFEQRVYLNHRSAERPLVMEHAGYASRKSYEHELSKILDANQIIVEYRYFGKSKPDSIDWKYLTGMQGITDHHKIVELFKPFYKGKWIGTGFSKGGASVSQHYRHFTKDFDVVLNYDAPITFGKEDPRTTEFIYSIGSKKQREAVLAFQQECLKRRKNLIPLFEKSGARYGGFSMIGADVAFEYAVLEYSFTYWQRGHYANPVPIKKSSDEEIMKHLLKTSGSYIYTDAGIKRFYPSFYQHQVELGYYGYPTEGLKDLLKAVKNPNNDIFAPANVDLTFHPKYVKDVAEWLRTKGNNMVFLFGEMDPWAANYIDLKDGLTNSVMHIQKNGFHYSKILQLSDEQKKDIYDRLDKWLGLKSNRL